MPFELLKGTTLGWIPEEHGYSQRELKDTIRRMEQLMVDLEKLWKRKEKEREFHKRNIPDWLTPNDWIGGVDYKKVIDKRLYDITSHLAIDKAVLEFEVPYLEEALENVPEETPPMRHEDYQKRLQNLENRRGEYWKINPEFITDEDRRAGIGRKTPEKDKYWPTHQVPWKQGAPSPLPLTPPPPPPPPPRPPPPPPPKTRSKRNPLPSKPCVTPTPEQGLNLPTETPRREHGGKGKLSSKVESTPPIQRTPSKTAADVCKTPSSVYYTPVGSRAGTPGDVSFLDEKPLFTPPSAAAAPDLDLKELANLVDEVDILTVQLLKVKSMAHDSVGSPEAKEDQKCVQQPTPPVQQPELEFGCVQQPTPPVQQPELEFGCVQQPTPPVQQPELEFGDESPGIICPERITTEAFSPEELGVDEMQIMMDDAVQRHDAEEFIDPHQLQCEAFSPEIMDTDTMHIMMDDAVQRHTAAEFIDPHQLHSEAFSPEYLETETIQRMLNEPRGPTALLSPDARQGMQMLKCEPQTAEKTASRYGYMREERWNERVGRWNADVERRKEEERSRAKSAEERHKDAEALFGIRARPISAPSEPPARSDQLCYEPQTLQWGESPVDHISPPPRMKPEIYIPPSMSSRQKERLLHQHSMLDDMLSKPKIVTGKGKKLVPPKPQVMPRIFDPYTVMAPSRLLYPKTKGGPTVSHPDRPTTTQTLYNTKRREYEYLDHWVPPMDPYQKKYCLEMHRETYEEMLKPGPPILPPKPATPPPPPPPEYGPEPEHLSVYVPESVYESPATLKQRLDEAIARFGTKIELVRKKLEARLPYRQESSWVREEYMDPKPTSIQKHRLEEEKCERERSRKWENFMFSKYGTVTDFDRYGRLKLPRTASTHRPRLDTPEPLPKKAPVNKPYDEPLYGPWLPWVAGSNRPPPRTAAGRIGSPYEPAPKPLVRKTVGPSPPKQCQPSREPVPRIQPAQVLYGSSRAPPKTAASYKYHMETPKAQPARACGVRPRRLVPSTPEMLYGSTRAPPKTAASSRSQIPMGQCQTTPQGYQDATPRCPPSTIRTPDPTRSSPFSASDISPVLVEALHQGEEQIERIRTQLSPVVDSLSSEVRQMLLKSFEKFNQMTGKLENFIESTISP